MSKKHLCLITHMETENKKAILVPTMVDCFNKDFKVNVLAETIERAKKLGKKVRFTCKTLTLKQIRDMVDNAINSLEELNLGGAK